ncbi:MAG: PKD domain-containing protein [Bacteroidetes bacterium]|nr:PKD domain-containing protein [Bacteroidota bacterium]
MRNYIYIIALFVTLPAISCKKQTEPSPVADFGFSLFEVYEGDTLVFLNSSKNVSVSFWEMPALNWKSEEFQPQYVFTDAGLYQVNLLVKNGDGLTDSKSLNVNVKPDSIYRLSGNSKKVWIVKSIIYNGNELQTQPCQMDDEFIVFHNQADTCNLTEGTDTCANGTYLFDLPATSQWRYNSAGTFEFALTAFGSPINLNFDIKYLSKDSFAGYDAINSVSFRLARKK